MHIRNEKQYLAKKIKFMEKSYECLADNGLTDTGLRLLSQYCECTTAKFYTYFDDLDDLTVRSTEYCMSKIE